METQKGIWIKVVLALIFMVLVTALLLPAAAAIVYFRELSPETAHIMISAIYAIVGLGGGFFAGKMMRMRKFLWGILSGLAYFACLVLVSLAVNGGTIEDVVQLLITFVLVVASSMIGGMLS
jgi:putative membrane protein (TIGR04086 family)